MRKRRSVALLLETSNAYARGLLDGIIAYQREHELWSIYVGEQERGARPPVWIKNWKGDGIIARIETEAIAAAVRRSRLPTVDVSAARLIPELPWVETDDREIAQMAARHLMDRGFRTLAFCGEPRSTGRPGGRSILLNTRAKRVASVTSIEARRRSKRDIPGPASGALERLGARICPSRSA